MAYSVCVGVRAPAASALVVLVPRCGAVAGVRRIVIDTRAGALDREDVGFVGGVGVDVDGGVGGGDHVVVGVVAVE